jgi:hypothetical protein
MGFAGSDGSLSSLKKLLAELEDAWKLYNRPHINTDLKSSLYSRMLEVRAAVVMKENLENKERKKQKETRRSAA